MKHEGFSNINSEITNPASETAESDEKQEIEIDRLKSIGGAALESIVRSRGTSSKSTGEFITREVSHEYRQDRMQLNLEFLNANDTPDYLKRTYCDLMSDFPQLRNIELFNMRPGEQNAFFNSVGPDESNLRPIIAYHFANPDIYMSEEHDMRNDLRGLDTVYLEIALRTGARPSDVMKNKKLVQTFIMCHEFGHALDFNDNYLEPALDEQRKLGKKVGVGAAALKDAYIASRRSRGEDMTQLMNGSLQSDSPDELQSVMYSRLLALGVKTDDAHEMNLVQKKSYRKTRSESFADTFAMNYIMKHQDEFFYDPKSGEDPDGRLPTYIGKTLNFPEEYLPCLDFVPGSHIGCHFKNKEGKDSTISSCYMANRLRIGDDFLISITGDPTDKSSMYSLGTVSRVLIRPQPGNKNFFFLMMEDGGSAVFAMNEEDSESPEIAVDGSEIEKRYRLGVGSELALLKVGQDADSAVKAGDLLTGKLKYSLRDGDGIALYGNRDANTSHVQRFYRRWKRYFAETKTSTYEILPIRKKH